MIRAPRRAFCALFIFILPTLFFAYNTFQSYAQGNDSGLSVQIDPAFEGAYKYGEWLPVWVTIDNKGIDREIEIQIEVKNDGGTTLYAAPLSLPGNSRKRTPIYVRPNAYSRELPLTIINKADRQNQILFEEDIPVQAVINRIMLVGLLSNERGPLSMIQNLELTASNMDGNFEPEFGAAQQAQQGETTLVDMRASDIPPKSEALRSFDIIIINDVDTSSLTPEQGTALEQWVRAGGTLLIGGGGSAQRTLLGLPTALRPQLLGTPSELDEVDALVQFSGSALQDPDESAEPIKVAGPFIAQAASFESDVTLAGDAEAPLVVEEKVGSGTVRYVALSLTGSPFDAWSGNTQFLQAILTPTTFSPNWLPADTSIQQMRAMQMSQALNRLPSLSLPSIRWLGILLCIYILVVGPLNYLVLRYFRRLHLAWITIPLLTLAFSAGAFGLGYALRGNDLILNHIAVVEPQPDGSSQVANYVGLFSPVEQTYQIKIDSDSLVLPMPQNNQFFMNGRAPNSTAEVGNMTIVNGNPAELRDFAISQWAMQSFQIEDRWDDFGAIRSELNIEDSLLVGTITNETNQPIQDVVLIMGQYFERIGEIGGGESKPVSFDITKVQNDNNNFGGSLWWNIYGSSGAPNDFDQSNEVKRQIAEAVFQTNYGGPPESNRISQGILLVGWLDQTPLDVHIADRIPTQQTTALVHTELSLTWPTEGTLTIPSSLMNVRMIQHPTNGGICGSPSYLHINSGSAVLEFSIPWGKGFENIDVLEMQVRNDIHGPQEGKTVDIEFYNWQDETWIEADKTERGDRHTDIYESNGNSNLLNPQGNIQVRISVDQQDNFGSCRFFDLNVTGEL